MSKCIKLEKKKLVRKLCKELGVSYPPEIAGELVKEDNKMSKPSKKEMDAMIEEVSELSMENPHTIDMPNWGISLKLYFIWEEDRNSSFYVTGFVPMKQYKNKLSNFMNGLINDLEGHFDPHDYVLRKDSDYDKIYNSKEFKKFQDRVDRVCKIADEWEEMYSDFDWSDDIYDRAVK